MTPQDPIQISESELRSMTADLEEMHHATFPQMREQLGDVGASLRRHAGRLGATSSSRRGFLMGSGVALGGLALAACSQGGSTSSKQGDQGNTVPSSTPGSGSSSAAGDDTAGLATNASLENLAVFAYGAALKAAPMGKFGKVPGAVAEFATHAMNQHADHANAFNAALTKAGKKPFTEPNPALKQTVLDAFGKLNDVPGLANLALLLENTAAATYVKQMGEFTSPEALSAVATIAPVERQHATILLYVLGQYPVPDAFVKLDLARPSTDAGV